MTTAHQTSPNPDIDLFVSYAQADENYVHQLIAALNAEGITTWEYSTRLRTGEVHRSKIEDAIVASKHGVVILSPAFYNSKCATHEKGMMLDIDIEQRHEYIFTVLHNGFTPADLRNASRHLYGQWYVESSRKSPEEIAHEIAAAIK